MHSVNSNSNREYGNSKSNMSSQLQAGKYYQSNQETRRNSKDHGETLRFMRETTLPEADASKCVYDAYLITNTTNGGNNQQ